MKNHIQSEKYDRQIELGIEYPTEPGVKKLYAVGCYTSEDWDYIHEVLLKDGTIEDNIPCSCIECVDLKEHSLTRAVYLLTDQEAEELLNHPKVEYVHENYESYPIKYKAPPEELTGDYIRNYRYASPGTLQYRNFNDNSQLPNPATSTEINRSGYQLLRCVNKPDPWYNGTSTGSNQIFTNRIQYYGDGSNVDVIVGDEGCWFGHVEFQSNATGFGPTNYIGGNKLKSGYSNSTTTGTCDLLDLVLDAPYYIDPAWFEANPASRLTLRWDGTTVPVDGVSISWWGDASQRSAAFSSIGTVTVTSSYTRANCNGSKNARPNNGTSHGTQCSANTYGRTQGWAFNSNKWVVNAYGNSGSDVEQYFDIMKLFHLYKPVNPIYGTKDPTISSNSWGYRSTDHRVNGYYYYRQGTSGGTGISYSSTALPGFINYVGVYGDGNRMKGDHLPNSYLTAGKEMIDAGVIFVGAAGNSNQKQVGPDHPDYNNYWVTSALGANYPLANATHSEFGVTAYNTTNRRGFPQQLGAYNDPITGKRIYPVINIGALDDAFASNGKERKVNYSDMGEEIDCYAPADGTLSATNSTSGSVRPDTYSEDGQLYDVGVTLIANTNTQITGTSSFSLLSNSAKRISTTNLTTGSVQNIGFNLIGSAALTLSTLPTTGNNDDGFWTLTLPFNIQFAGITTNTIYPGTNTYITFGSGSVAHSSLSVSNPLNLKIMISCADNSCQRLYYGTGGSSPNRTYRIRYEGANGISGTAGSPNMVYEAIFYEATPNQIDIHVGSNARITATSIISYDSKFSGTSSACPVACGIIATKLQHNRSWTWQDVRTWLKNTVGDADTAKFDVGVESTSANDVNWQYVNSLEGGRQIVIWDAITGNEPIDNPPIIVDGVKMFSGEGLKLTGPNLKILYQ